ncbi:YkvA family protein [Novilysobacter erysipheiresistens]|uniref:DUF1232 domain-containing protein n=1 Tax=Novilysobacter erysipheiresistens TaxID=1749332 RepID=A0ABU7YU66_9GAMM
MNAMTATARSLPTTIAAAVDLAIVHPLPSSPQNRRRTVGGFSIPQMEVDRFNAFLLQLGRTGTPLQRDQLATAARELCDRNIRSAPGIGPRMRRAAAAALMLADPAWEARAEAAALASLVVGYVHARNDLFPDDLPGFGRLDDAIVIDTAWPRLADEIADYLDYRRVRQIEARLRGCSRNDFGFGRDQWEQAFRAEAALAEHQRQARTRSYLPASIPRFHIH